MLLCYDGGRPLGVERVPGKQEEQLA